MQNRWFEGMHACCFTGHRPAGLPDHGEEKSAAMDALKLLLLETVSEAVHSGVTTFLAGGAAGFDLLAAEAVLALKGDMPRLELILALPAKNPWEALPVSLRERYDRVLSGAANIYYASEERLGPTSMKRRNRYLVDHADGCIAYLKKMTGGTLYTVNYAMDMGVPVLNLALPL